MAAPAEAGRLWSVTERPSDVVAVGILAATAAFFAEDDAYGMQPVNGQWQSLALPVDAGISRIPEGVIATASGTIVVGSIANSSMPQESDRLPMILTTE